jgi:chromosome segregation ATPase
MENSMGREAMVSHEQVAAAADALKAGGGKPTSRAIRERLGNVGSLGTINKMLQQWKEGQKHQTTAAVLPPPLQRALLEFIDQELAAARALLAAELAEQQQETADLATENERLLESMQNQAAQLESLAAEKAAADGRCAQLEADLEDARDDAARERHAAELARTECAKALSRREAMPRREEQLAAVRSSFKHERGARIGAEQAAAALDARKADLDSRLSEAGAPLQRLEQQNAASQEKAERLAAELADARVAVETGQAPIALRWLPPRTHLTARWLQGRARQSGMAPAPQSVPG